MKYQSLFYSLIITAFILSGILPAQEPEWVIHTNTGNVYTLVEEGNIIWAGTDQGLVKIDKISGDFTQYNCVNSKLPTQVVTDIVIDKHGNKWINAYRLAVFNNNNWTVFDTLFGDVIVNNILSIAIDESNVKWIGTRRGLLRYDGSTWTKIMNNGQEFQRNIHTVIVDKAGNKWMKIDGAIAKFKDSTWTLYDSSNSPLNHGVTNYQTPSIIAIDSMDNKWIATSEGLFKFDDTTWTVYDTTNSGLPSNHISTITVDGIGNIWLGLGKENSSSPVYLVKFSDTTCTVYDTTISHLKGLLDINSILITEDNQKLLAVTRNNYNAELVIKFNDTTWSEYGITNSHVPKSAITSITTDKVNNTWVGTEYYGIAQFNGSQWTAYSTPILQDYRTSGTIASDNENNLWVILIGDTWNTRDSLKIAKFDGTSWTTYDLYGQYGYYDNLMVIDNKGNKWIKIGHSLIKFDGENLTEYNSTNSNLPASTIHSIATDKSNKLWLGTEKGLVKFNDTSFTIYDTSNSDLPANYIKLVTLDNDDNVWMAVIGNGMSGGIIKFDGKQWTHYNLYDIYQEPNFVGGLAVDKTNNIWAVLPFGLLKFDGINWEVYDIEKFAFYDRYWSNSTKINLLIPTAVDTANNIWIGGRDGKLVVLKQENIIPIINEISPPNNITPKITIQKSNHAYRLYYSVTKSSHISLKVFDIKGRCITTLVNSFKKTGRYETSLNTNNLANGTYFINLRIGNNEGYTKKLFIVK
jgi:ligand-binding sensor domain-containing protein